MSIQAFEDDIRNCTQILDSGGVILYPTDTIWGLGCDATNAEAVEKVFAIKQRPKEKSMIVLLAEAKDILYYVAAPPPDIIAIVESFKEPTTVIYEDAIDLPENVINPKGTIAIRVTKDPFCKALIKRFQKPIISTSANLSGDSSPAIFSEINNDVISASDYVVKYRQQDNEMKKPSRIVRFDEEGNLLRIR